VPYAAGGFYFARATLIRDVPFDPNMINIFEGEEMLYRWVLFVMHVVWKCKMFNAVVCPAPPPVVPACGLRDTTSSRLMRTSSSTTTDDL
jgi:hypothetical protein